MIYSIQNIGIIQRNKSQNTGKNIANNRGKDNLIKESIAPFVLF